MFLTIAEYEDNYLRYLQKKVSVDEAGFLTMHQLGPFYTDEGNNMDLLAALLKTVIPYAIAFPPTTKSPSPPPEPGQSKPTKKSRGRQLPAAQGPGLDSRDPSPMAALAQGVQTMTVTGGTSEVEGTPPDNQQSGRVLRSHTASRSETPTDPPADPQVGQSGGQHGIQPAPAQRGQSDGGRGGPGRGRGRGEAPARGGNRGGNRGSQGGNRGGNRGSRGGNRGGRG
jgi:hypothetical protein